jgi:hypothetical protein
MYQPTTVNHPGLTPQSDGRRLVFPLSQWSGTFKTEHFMPSIVDYRCSADDIHLFLNDLYFATKRLKPFRLANRLIMWSFLIYIFCFIFGIMIEMDAQDSMYYYDNEGEMTYYYPEQDDTGIFLILGGMFMLIFINIWALIYRNQAKTQLFRQMVNTLERHKYNFLQKGLRWSVPENCQWLELWMDYRFFSPYYMQPFMPSVTGQPNAIPALTRDLSQTSPLCQNTTTQAIQANNTTNANNSTGNNGNGQSVQAPQGYPVFEVPMGQNNTEASVNRVGYMTMPQYGPQQFGPQQQMGYGYPFFQPPQLTENLLGYQVPVQGMRM